MQFPESTSGDSSAEEDIAATRRFVGEDADVVGGGAENAHFTGVRHPGGNREQRRKTIKGLSKERMEVTGIVVHFKNGQYVNLDTTRVMISDRVTGKPLFEEILEQN
jgi:hypothetical protein